mmetsp:Transcript_47692/g.63017  ORF Transcript_47692/g.63017 Transcript_47692/m.63017 type:complete len:132 (-) Transcript_47692:61-456(-)
METARDKLPMLVGDSRRLKQVLINLVKNALKFTASGCIQIMTCYDAHSKSLVVHVKDSGVGIDSEDIPILFQKFGKLHRTVKMNSDGVGLGLTIVKQVVEASKGHVEVQSAGVGHGSCFIFSMQIEKSDNI